MDLTSRTHAVSVDESHHSSDRIRIPCRPNQPDPESGLRKHIPEEFCLIAVLRDDQIYTAVTVIVRKRSASLVTVHLHPRPRPGYGARQASTIVVGIIS